MHRFAILGIAAMLGCASSGTAIEDQGEPLPGSSQRSSNVISREEIQNTGLTNMMDVIRRLRPNFLTARGPVSINLPPPEIVVYLDDVRYGGVNMLSNIGAASVVRVEYIRGTDTAVRFGLDHAAGVILISTR